MPSAQRLSTIDTTIIDNTAPTAVVPSPIPTTRLSHSHQCPSQSSPRPAYQVSPLAGPPHSPYASATMAVASHPPTWNVSSRTHSQPPVDVPADDPGAAGPHALAMATAADHMPRRTMWVQVVSPFLA